MNKAAVTARPGTLAQVRIREPAGERTLDAPLTIGGEGAQVVVPGTAAGPALQVARRDGVWFVQRTGQEPAGLDGQPLRDARDLRRGDVFHLGDAQIVVIDLSRTLLRLEVCHLVGNTTIAPVGTVAALGVESDEDGDLQIRVIGARPGVISSEPSAEPAVAAQVVTGKPPRSPVRWRRWAGAIAAAAALVGVLVLVSMLEPVAVDIQPADARVRTPGTWLSLHTGDRVFVMPGDHLLRAERQGYVPAEEDITVRDGELLLVRLRLAKLPGKLDIDTGGVAATVSADGAVVGRAPGEVEVPAGSRTITLRAPRYLDYVTTVEVEGASVRQELKASLQPAWGTLNISSNPAGARVSVDGREVGPAPASVDLDAGVRRIELAATGLKTWQSSVVIKAGETLSIGPITLGQPDARQTVRSVPAGAQVSVGGALRGRTPVTVDLSSGANHDVVLALPGYANFTRTVFAEPGKPIAIDARLDPQLGAVSVQGEPADAEVLVDGASRGRAPQSLKLTTIQHKIEVRKPGFQPFTTDVTPATGLERFVKYKLVSADRGTALQESAPTITTKSGYTLKLAPRGTFVMGSDRREQGRRPNEGMSQISLRRPFYIGTMEVTNADFRKFRPGHSSGYVEKRSFDLDNQPVTRVSWEDAAEYCNWLSEQEGLVPAYDKSGSTYVLKRPATNGYRLPTEAEWEFAARFAGSDKALRFAWGDALPVAPQTGNIAGKEASKLLNMVLEAYTDEFPSMAPVGKFTPNALGLHDVSGNVSEWVNDYYLSFVDNVTATDPLGPEQGTRHVIKGANWQSAQVTQLRLAWRDGANESSQLIGFRVARYAD
jgi:formylglycine-generating enzyme required for sulfatase activity